MAEGRSIHHEMLGKHLDRRGPEPLQIGQDGVLVQPQPRRRERLVIEPRDVPGGLAQRRARTGF